MSVTTPQQRQALAAAWQRERDSGREVSYLAFRRTIQVNTLLDCLMVPMPACGYWLGIEIDGYAHT